MTSAAVDAIAAHGLRTLHRLGGEDLPPEAFDQLLERCERHRVIGLLARAVTDGAITLESAPRDALETRLQGWLAHDVRVEQLLLRARARLWRAGIPNRVLKGVALSHTAYADPAHRVFGDADLLVPTGHFLAAVDELEQELATRRVQPELRPGFDERFGKEVLLRSDGLELDLHRVFVEGALGLTIDTADLFVPPYRFALGGAEVEALPMPQRLLHACYAAALGDWPPRLISLRDVAQLVIREEPNLVDVLLMARRWQCEAVVARAVSTAWQRLRLTDRSPIVEWSERYQPGRRERLLLAAHEGSARAFTRHVAAVFVLSNVAERAAYARAIAFPQPAYLRARGESARSHVSRAVRRVTRKR